MQRIVDSATNCLELLSSPALPLMTRLLGEALAVRHLLSFCDSVRIGSPSLVVRRHDCHVGDSGAWRQPGGEQASRGNILRLQH
jgi:hypothetical protein